MMALLEFMTKLNINDDDSQDLAIQATKEARRICYNAITNSFKLALPKFSSLEERKLQQGIKDHEQKITKIDQSLPRAEQKLEEAENRAAVVRAELAQAEAKVARCREGITVLTEEKAAISGSISGIRLSIRTTNVYAKTRTFIEGLLGFFWMY